MKQYNIISSTHRIFNYYYFFWVYIYLFTMEDSNKQTNLLTDDDIAVALQHAYQSNMKMGRSTYFATNAAERIVHQSLTCYKPFENINRNVFLTSVKRAISLAIKIDSPIHHAWDQFDSIRSEWTKIYFALSRYHHLVHLEEEYRIMRRLVTTEGYPHTEDQFYRCEDLVEVSQFVERTRHLWATCHGVNVNIQPFINHITSIKPLAPPPSAFSPLAYQPSSSDKTDFFPAGLTSPPANLQPRDITHRLHPLQLNVLKLLQRNGKYSNPSGDFSPNHGNSTPPPKVMPINSGIKQNNLANQQQLDPSSPPRNED